MQQLFLVFDMIKINFIRHGETAGNKLKKYIGSTDEELCEEGKNVLRENIYPDCDMLLVSPMKRCIQTAEIIYPKIKYIICQNFRECDFGIFENKNYIELSDVPEYQKWIDGNCTGRCPNGDDPFEFKKRCTDEFIKFMKSIPDNITVSLVIHGGVIMSILEKYAVPHREFYQWHIKNGQVLTAGFENDIIKIY